MKRMLDNRRNYLCVAELKVNRIAGKSFVPDYNKLFNFIIHNPERFYVNNTPVEYYEILGDWVAGSGLLDLYKEVTEKYIFYRMYRRI